MHFRENSADGFDECLWLGTIEKMFVAAAYSTQLLNDSLLL